MHICIYLREYSLFISKRIKNLKKYIHHSIWVVLTMLLAAIFVVTAPFFYGGQGQKAHASGAAAIKLGSKTLTANTQVQITGTGFTADDSVRLYIDSPD